MSNKITYGKAYTTLIPANARSTSRRTFDSTFCHPYKDKETLGDRCPWTILKRSLDHNSIVYSGGAGEDISFELALIERFGLTVQLYDPTPGLGAVTATTGYGAKLHFRPLGLAGAKGPLRFEPSDKEGVGGLPHLRKAVDRLDSNQFQLLCTTLEDEMKANGHARMDLLKLDIEGFEYEVLDSCLDSGILPKQICVEFHHFMENMPSRVDTARLLLRLIRCGCKLVHKTQYDYTFYSRRHLQWRGGDHEQE